MGCYTRTQTHSGGNRYGEATLANSRLGKEDQQKVNLWMKNPKNFLIFLGCPGSGKSHFCYSILNDLKKSEKILYKRLWNESTFISRVKSSFDMVGSFENEVEYLCDDDLMIFDDMGSTNTSDWKKDILFKFVDVRYQSKKPTVVTSNFKESEIQEKLGYRIHSRLFDKENIILNFGEIDWRQIELNDRP